nr:hypothetical protein Iba_scaffold874928CG0030 [Ipomoea batatas]
MPLDKGVQQSLYLHKSEKSKKREVHTAKKKNPFLFSFYQDSSLGHTYMTPFPIYPC